MTRRLRGAARARKERKLALNVAGPLKYASGVARTRSEFRPRPVVGPHTATRQCTVLSGARTGLRSGGQCDAKHQRRLAGGKAEFSRHE